MKKVHAVKLVNTKNMTRLDWLKARKSGIGGSDAASIAGLNKYTSPLAVWLDKTEVLNDVEEPPISEAAEWGTRQEPLIRSKFKDNHPEWRVQQSNFMWQHPTYSFMLANVDGMIFCPKKGWGILEIKTASEWLNDDWGEEQAPENYIIQFQHYLSVMGLDWGVFAVLIGGNKYREFYIERDEQLINYLIEIEQDFWYKHVLANIPPSPDGSESSAEVLMGFHPTSSALPQDEILELDTLALELIRELDDIKQGEKETKKRKEEIHQKLQLMLGDYQVAAVEDRKVSWKVSNSFNEKELQKEKPDLYNEFSKVVLDKDRFKKAFPKVYKEFMLPTNKKSFTVKEFQCLYVI